ncbi:MAG: branched-chain amino acid ABC transporter permease [Ruminococcaceae bacterium]|nr:branched-chain amino acid ABC transporter permease [Oscillospiraceae bacterium]
MKIMNKASTRGKIGFLAVLTIITLVFPLVVKNQYIVRMGTLSLMYVGLSFSLNFVTGFLGQVSLGHAAFLGIGAYTSAILSERLELPFLVTALMAMLVSAFFGMLLGIPALHLSGSYLSIVTLGFCEIVRIVELNWVSLTRGPMGITGIARPNIFGIQIKSVASYYYLCLFLVAIIGVIIANILNSHVGRGIMSVREDSIAAAAMGVNVFRYKVMTFTISAAFAGLMGAFYAHYMLFIDPSSFNFDQSLTILSMVILGGLGSLPGSVIGALLLSIVPELLRGLAEARMLFYGLALTFMMILRPQGLLGRVTLYQLLGIKKKFAPPPAVNTSRPTDEMV